MASTKTCLILKSVFFKQTKAKPKNQPKGIRDVLNFLFLDLSYLNVIETKKCT